VNLFHYCEEKLFRKFAPKKKKNIVTINFNPKPNRMLTNA